MKISINWLKEYLDINIFPEKLVDEMNNIGLLVDQWEEKDGDVILELETYANRPDTLGHLGVAREIAASQGIPLKDQKFPVVEGDENISDVFDVQVLEEDLCPRYCGMIIKGFNNGPSPPWLIKRIQAMGLSPVNHVVDVTNYVLFSTAQPIHAFDLSKLSGDKIIVRKAMKGEELKVLGGESIQLSNDMLVIADEKKPLALAGVVGGEETAVTDESKDIFIESACFDPVSIRKTWKEAGIQTDASYRFERGTDISFPPEAARMVASLLTKEGGKALKGLVDIYPKPRKVRTVVLRHHRVSQLLGIEIEEEFIADLLKRMGFQVENQNEGIWRVQVPHFRVDLEREADLIEEIARFYGYDKIPSHLPVFQGINLEVNKRKNIEDRIRELLFHEGFDEVVNYSFMDTNKEKLFKTSSEAIEIRNPVSSKASLLRTTLLEGLLGNIVWNINRGAEGIHAFEIGNIFYQNEGKCFERYSLGMVTMGQLDPVFWQKEPEKSDFFHLKGTCEELLRHLKFDEFSFTKEENSFFEGNYSLSLSFKGEKIGILGQMKQSIVDAYSIEESVWAAEINLGSLLEKQPKPFEYIPVSRYPGIVRDVSFISDRDISYQEIKDCIEKLNIPYLEDYVLYDRFTGKEIPGEKISLSFRFVFRHPEKTLLAEEADSFQDKIIQALNTEFGLKLRGGGQD
ncbi:MAG: phenylalanine--tRNA ligase subunit beta [Candidatus Aminicenantes bacterium]|nr:phenylalanine--tRNA ligase subunit beta [Candidatus Aminicenantes bacterium]